MESVVGHSLIGNEEQIRSVLLVRELQRRMKEERASFYQPNIHQLAFHKATEKYRLVHGGNRGGKTECVCEETHWCASGKHPYKEVPPPPTHYVVCGDGMTEQVDRVLVQKFREIVPRETLKGGEWKSAWSDKYHTLTYANGSTIHFMSYDQDVGKLSGVSLDGAVLDESCNASENFWKELNARLIDRNGWAVFAVTPIYGLTWEYKFYERAKTDPDVAVFRLPTRDNIANLSADGIAALESQIGDDENERRIRLEGDFLAIGGLIYPILDPRLHRKTGAEVGMNDSWSKYLAIDPGINKDHVVLWGAVGPGRHIHFYRELYVSGPIHPDLKAEIRTASGLDRMEGFRLDGHWDWDNRTARSAADQDKYLNIEKEFFIPPALPVIKAPVDIRRWQGIDHVRTMLRPDPTTQKPLITFSPECERAWYEMTHYMCVPPGPGSENRHNPRIRKVDDDAPDCVRIFVTSDLQYTGGALFMPVSHVVVDEYGLAW